MNAEIEKLIKLAIADGTITEKEKEIIFRKAEKLGEDIDEVELILNGELALLKEGNGESFLSLTGGGETTISKEGGGIKVQPQLDYINKNGPVINSFLQSAMLFLNKHKFLKFSLIFMLTCLAFNLLTQILF
jgi:hypothetical protein